MPQYIQQYTYDASTNLVNLKHQPDGGTVTGRYQPVRTTSNRQQTEQYDSVGNQVSRETSQDLAYNSDGSLAYLSWQDKGYQITEYYTYISPGVRGRKVTEVRTLLTNMLVQVDTVSYVGEVEFRASYTGTNLSYDGDLVTDESGNEVSPTIQRSVTRIKSGHSQVGKIDKNELTDTQTIRYNVLNHLDSNELVLDEDGQLTHYRSYAPYGETLDETKADTTESELGYSGQEEDESGLVYYGHRYYQKNGRWNRADPIRFKSGQLNMYNMVNGNPVTSRDKWGLLEEIKMEDIQSRNIVKLKEFRDVLKLIDYISTTPNEDRRALIFELNHSINNPNNDEEERSGVGSMFDNDESDDLEEAFEDYMNGKSDGYLDHVKARTLPVNYLDQLKLLAKQRTFERLQIADGQPHALTSSDWDSVKAYIGEKTSTDEYADLQGLKDAWKSFRGHRTRLATNRDVLSLVDNQARNFKQDFQGLMDIALARTRVGDRIGGVVPRPEFRLRRGSGQNQNNPVLRTSTKPLNYQNSDDEEANVDIRIQGDQVHNGGLVRTRNKGQITRQWKIDYEAKIRKSIESGHFALAWNPAIVDRYTNKLYRYQRSFAHKHNKSSNSWLIGENTRGGYVERNNLVRALLPPVLLEQMDDEARATGRGSFDMRSVAWIKSGPYDEDVDNNLTKNDWRNRRRQSNHAWHYGADDNTHTTYYDAAKATTTTGLEIGNNPTYNWRTMYGFSYYSNREHRNVYRDHGHFGLRRASKAHADERVVTNLINTTIPQAKNSGAAIKSEDISIISYRYSNGKLQLYTRCPGCHSSTLGVAEHNLYE